MPPSNDINAVQTYRRRDTIKTDVGPDDPVFQAPEYPRRPRYIVAAKSDDCGRAFIFH